MSGKISVLFVLLALVYPIATGYAQGTPPDEIYTALADLSARAGQNLTLSDLSSWSWTQTNYPDSSLGCPQPGLAYLQVVTPGYRFLLEYNGATFDYRVSADNNTVIRCSGPETVPAAPAQQPTLTPTPPAASVPAAATPEASRTVCDGAMPTRLSVGLIARVRPAGLPVNIRTSPSSSSPRAGQMNPGDTFSIIGGPQCAEILVWWQITFGQISGWAGEGANNVYWIEPTGDTVATPAPAATPASQPETISEVPHIYSLPGGNQPPISVANAGSIDRLIEIPLSEPITNIAWSGEVLAVTSFSGLRVVNMLALQETPRFFQVPNGPTNAVVISPDGTLIVTGHNDATVRLWDVSTGGLRAVLRDHTQPVRAVAYSPDGLLIASAGGSETMGEDSAIRLWDANTQSLLATLTGHTGAVTALAFSPDSSLIASAGLDNTVRLWNVASAAPGTVLSGYTQPVRTLAFSPDGTWLASAGDQGTIALWEVGPGTQALLEGQPGPVVALAFNADGTMLVSASGGELYFWDLSNDTQVTTLSDYGAGPTAVVNALAFPGDGTMLAFATSEGDRGMVRIWGNHD
jgi:WD40 repeat protein